MDACEDMLRTPMPAHPFSGSASVIFSKSNADYPEEIPCSSKISNNYRNSLNYENETSFLVPRSNFVVFNQ
jgi:hypothetical protein